MVELCNVFREGDADFVGEPQLLHKVLCTAVIAAHNLEAATAVMFMLCVSGCVFVYECMCV